jgi:hypothetical protein
VLREILCDIWNGLKTAFEELGLVPMFVYWMVYILSLVDPR